MYIRLSLKLFLLLFSPKNMDIRVKGVLEPYVIRLNRCPHYGYLCTRNSTPPKRIDIGSIPSTNLGVISHARRYRTGLCH